MKRKKYRNNIVINSIKTSKKLQKIERLISPATHTHTHTPATLKPSSLLDLPCSFHVTDWVCFFLLNSYPILPVQVFQQECIFPSFQEKNKHCMIHSFNNMDISILAFQIAAALHLFRTLRFPHEAFHSGMFHENKGWVDFQSSLHLCCLNHEGT